MGNTETLVHIGCWSWGRRLPRRSGKVPQRCREHNEGLFVEQLFFYTTLACVKLSLLFFFRRVGWYMTKLRVAWWSVLGFVVACWIASVGDAQWGCLVATGFDIMAQCTEPPAIAYANLTLRVNCALDVLSDAAVLSIPIILIWDAKLRTAEKLAFISLFSLTLLTMLVAILRVVGISSAKWANGQVDPSYLWLWSCIETCIAIIVACLTAFPQLFVSSKSLLCIKSPGLQVDQTHAQDTRGKKTLWAWSSHMPTFWTPVLVTKRTTATLPWLGRATARPI